MEQSWWGPAVQWTVWGILMTLVMGWVARSRFKNRPHSDSQRLVHPPSTLIIGVVVFLFFAGIATISNVFANKTVRATVGWLVAGDISSGQISVE
jgi:hypothetical protein